jgi:hypothetical protein
MVAVMTSQWSLLLSGFITRPRPCFCPRYRQLLLPSTDPRQRRQPPNRRLLNRFFDALIVFEQQAATRPRRAGGARWSGAGCGFPAVAVARCPPFAPPCGTARSPTAG